MTAERVDHAVEAVALLARSDKQGDTPLADALALQALVHATLAVAEQQRIANVLRFPAGFTYLSESEQNVIRESVGLPAREGGPF